MATQVWRHKQALLGGGVLTVALGILLFLFVTVVYGSQGTVIGTAHDLGSPGNPTCTQCHTPHYASGSYLWAMTPASGMSGLQALCFSCHDGTITSKGTFISDSNYETHQVNPGVANQDCDRCHDPHADSWKFTNALVSNRNANVCASCHSTGATSHPIDQTADAYSPGDRTWDPYLPTPDHSGTRLWDITGTSVVAAGSGYIKCMTCHVPHGAALDSKLNAMQFEDPGSSSAPICENCH